VLKPPQLESPREDDMKRKFQTTHQFQQLTLLAGIVAFNCLAISSSRAALTAFPFNRSLDTDRLEKIAAAPTAQAKVAELTAMGVSVYKVTPEDGKSDGTFSFLPDAPEALKAQLNGDSTIYGLTISPYNPCCHLKSQAVLIKSNATEDVLVHESAHVLMERALDEKEARENVEIRANEFPIERRFNFNFRYAMNNPAEVFGPHASLWRKNLVDYTTDYAPAVASISRVEFAEEVIAEVTTIEALRKAKSQVLTADVMSNALDFIKMNLDRIATRVGDVEFVSDWILSDIYGSDSTIEIPLAESVSSTKRIKEAVATVQATYDEEQKLEKLAEDVLTN
jgi:hypothetical protein